MSMTAYNATLVKKVNGVQYIVYPKTLSSMVKHGNTTVYATLSSMTSDISTLQTKTTNISYSSGTTSISGILDAGDQTLKSQTINEGEYIDVKLDSNGNMLEWTDADGDKHFGGNIYAPNIDELLDELNTTITVSLNAATASLTTRVTSLESYNTSNLVRIAATESAITTLNATAATSGSVDYKIAALETKYGFSTSTENPEFVQLITDSSNLVTYAVYWDGTIYAAGITSPTIDGITDRLDIIELALGIQTTIPE